MKPLAYLAYRRLINSLKRIPRTPRLLLPVIFFTLFFGLVTVAYFLPHGRRGAAPDASALLPGAFVTGGPGALIAAMRGILLLSVFSSIVSAMGEGNLFFSQSDVDFLFPAPLARRHVLLFRMLGRYAGLLFPAAYLPLALGGGALSAAYHLSPFAMWPGIVGAWLFLVAAANCAQVGLLIRPRREDADNPIEDPARQTWRARVRNVASFAAAALIVLGGWAAIRTMNGGAGEVAKLLRFINSQAVSVALAPIAWASDLFRVAFTGWTLSDVGRLARLFVLASVSFLWLFSRNHDFYESATTGAEKRTRLTRAVQGGDAGTILSEMAQEGKFSMGRTPAPFGVGARAVLWKDTIAIVRTPPRSWLTLAITASLPALFSLLAGQRRSDVSVLVWMVIFTMQMSALFLLSLRDMLRRADISKALPIAPARLLLAELALSIAQLTVLGWISLGVLLLTGAGHGPLSLVAALVLPTLATLLLIVQTIFILLYPRQNDPAQNAVGGLLSVLASLLALLPSLLGGLLLYLAGITPFLLGVSVAGINAVSALCALFFAAFLWQRFDPTD